MPTVGSWHSRVEWKPLSTHQARIVDDLSLGDPQVAPAVVEWLQIEPRWDSRMI